MMQGQNQNLNTTNSGTPKMSLTGSVIISNYRSTANSSKRSVSMARSSNLLQIVISKKTSESNLDFTESKSLKALKNYN